MPNSGHRHARREGPELQQDLKLRRRKIPTLFITGQTDESIRRQLLEQGALGFLIKPFTDDTLVGAINAALQVT